VKLSAYSVKNVEGSITPTSEGAATSVSLATPGQEAIYTVSGTAGEAVSLKSSSTSFSPEGGQLEWLNPEDKVIALDGFSKTENRFFKQVRFAATGTYKLVVHPSEASTGSMTLTAYNASDVTGTITPSAEGETKTVTISVPGQFARYTFTGTEGETVTLKANEATIANGWISVLDPEGGQVSGSEANFSGSGASVEITLAKGGTYTILLEPVEGDTGSLELTAYLGSHPGFVRRPAADSGAGVLPRAVSLLSGPVAAIMTDGSSSGVGPGAAHTAVSGVRASGGGRGAAGAARAAGRWYTRRARAARLAHPMRSEGRGLDRMEPLVISTEMRRFRPRHGAWQPPTDARGHLAWESGEPQSPWSRAARLQGAPGATAVSGQVLAQDGLPIAGVRVGLEGTDIEARTDEAGRFLLSGRVPSGRQVLVVEGERAPRHVRYGTYSVGMNIVASKTNMLAYTIWLTPLDRSGDMHITSPTSKEVRLTTSQVPGLEVRIPAGSVITNRTGRVVHELNLTAIPVDRPPFPLPGFVEVPVYFTVQPGGGWLSKGAQIIYPNWGHLRPGQRVDFWNYEPKSRGWYVYGEGTVTPDGKQVIPDPGVRVWEFSGAMITSTPGKPGKGPKPGAPSWGADPVDLGTGLFVYHKRDLVIPDTIPIVIERTYRQADSNSYSFGVGETSLYDMRLWSEDNYHEADLILPNGGSVRYVRTSPGEGYTEAEYEATETPGIYYASTLKWNGDGWNLTLTNGITYVFGVEAPLQAIRDRYGNQLTLTREDGQHGNIIQITSPHGHWVKLSYNSSSDVTEIKDNTGRTLKYAYNKAGYLESATDAAGRTSSYEYNSAGELAAIKDGRGKVYVETEYESHGRVAKQTLASGGVYSISYSEGEGGQVTAATVTCPRKVERRMTFNSEGYPTSEVNALGTSIQQTTSYEPQAKTGLPLSVTDPLGRKTTYKYDSSGNITQQTLLAGTSSARTLEYTYEPGTNEIASYTNALKQKTTYHHGEHGELLSVTDPLGHKVSAEYDPEGQPTSVTNALGKTTKLGYEFGALTSITDPLGRTTRRFVDADGRVASLTSPDGERTISEYNADNQLIKATDPLGDVTSYEYDGDGNLIATTDPNKHKSTDSYGPTDLLESETDALEHTTKATYDQDGNITELTDRDGHVSKFTYDALDRLTEARFGVSGESAESTIKYEYDAGNRLTKIIDSATGTYTPEYDEFNRLKSLATPNGTVSYGYNEANERTSMTAPGQEALKYTYDEAGRLTELKRGSQAVSITYNEANLPTKTTLPDGIEESYGYDEANELTSIAYTKGKTKLGELDYAYNTNGLREAVWGSYARTNLPEALSSASYNADDELTERNGTKLSYDADGNLTSNGTSEYKWNARGQLAEITGATKASFAYDPFGRRVSKTLAGTTTKLLFDGPNVVQETQASATTNLLTGLAASNVFARTTSTATESLLTDALGSTIGLGNSSGKVETSYTYDPFGATTKEGTASENPYQYTGLENDGNGLYDARARYYNSTNARFISQDPLGQEANGPNTYRYSVNSPTNAIDPYGTNLQAPLPGGQAGPPSGAAGASAPGSPGSSSGTSAAPGVGTSSPGAGGVGGSFGPAPTGCQPTGKGGALGEVASCRHYEKVEQAEEENRKEKERQGAEEYEKGTKERAGKILQACGVGGSVGTVWGAAGGGGGALIGGASGCLLGGAGQAAEIIVERIEEF
jgi:RHS repeat-associated protein